MLPRNKSGNSSGRSANVNTLDMDLKDILREHVLRLLPAKALFRSLAVCRDWKLQISTPFFIHNQSVSCRSLAGLFVQSPGGLPFFLPLDQMAYGVPDQELKFLPEPVDVKSSDNGLLCCVGRGPERAYYVCNPVNQQWKKLPKPSTDHGPNPAIAMVFEPSVLSFIVEFKVVCVFASTDIEEAYKFEIYSSDRDSWEVSSEMYVINSGNLYGRVKTQGIQFGRVIYAEGVVYLSMNCGTILAVDIRTQKTAEITRYGHGYGDVYGGLSPLNMGTMYGHLCTSFIRNQSVNVTVIHNDRHANTMSSEAREADLNKNHVSHLNFEGVRISSHDVPQVLFTWDGNVVFRAGNDLFSHDMKRNRTRAFVQGEREIDDGYTIVPYVNSLVSLM